MKTCPNCSELLGDNVERYFKCNYSFKLRRIVSNEEAKENTEELKKEQVLLEPKKKEQLRNNPLFEYTV